VTRGCCCVGFNAHDKYAANKIVQGPDFTLGYVDLNLQQFQRLHVLVEISKVGWVGIWLLAFWGAFCSVREILSFLPLPLFNCAFVITFTFLEEQSFSNWLSCIFSNYY